MKVTFKICPYKPGSAGARHLKAALEKLVGYTVERVGADYELDDNVWVVNWGAGHYIGAARRGAKNVKVLNPASKIVSCINKIDFFEALNGSDVCLPRWTTRKHIALQWAEAGKTIYCRGDVEGRDGRGISVASSPEDVVNAHLYTVAIPADDEYRVHVFRNKPIFDLIKVHHRPTKAQLQVRTGGNGWNFHRDVTAPAAVTKQAILVSRTLGLDFCAVDILYAAGADVATVLEANSAPELGPWTSAAYARELVALTK